MAEVGSLFVRLRADASEFEQTMTGVSGQLDQTGGKLQGIGGTMTKKVTTPLVGVATAAVMVGANFDDQMAKVSAISGATGDDFELLRGTAQELGATTRFSASEAAEGLEYLALAGWDANEMASGLGGVLDLASAAGMDLGRTSDIVTDTMSAFGIEASDSERVADMFATTSSNANTNVEQLGEALSKAGPTLSAMGFGLDETQAALGLMADQGLKGSRAGTALQGVMRDLMGSAEDGTVSFGEFDVALYNADGSMRDFGDILTDLEGGLEGMSDEQRNAALSSVFQQQALQGINPLLGEGSERYDELRDSIINSEGASQRMSDTMEDTLGGSFRSLKSQVEGVLIQLSDVLTPVIRDQVMPIVERLVEFISNLIDRFNNLDPSVQGVILGILGLLAAAGPVLIIIGTVVKVVGLMAAGMAVLASPIILVVGAIALLAAGLYLAYTRSETFRNIVDSVLSFVRDVAIAVFDRISDRIMEFADNVLPELIATFEFVRDKVETAVKFIWNKVIKPIFGKVSDFISDHSDTILGVLTDVWGLIESGISTAVDIIEGVIVAFLAVIRGDWETAWNAVKGIVSSVWDYIKNVFQTLVDWVVGIFKWLWRQLVGGSIIPDMISDILSAIIGLKDDFIGFISDLIHAVIDFFVDMAIEVWDTVSGWVSDIVGVVIDLYDDVTSAVSELVSEVIEFFTGMASDAWETAKQMGADVLDAVVTMVTDLIDEVESLPGRILSALGDAASLLVDWGKDLIGGLIDGVTGMLPDLDISLGGITDRLPFSPAKTGPLRSVTKNPQGVLGPLGEGLMSGLADGVRSRFSDVDNALSGLTADLGSLDIDSMMPSPAPAPAGNVRQVVIHNEMGGEHIETLILDVLTGELRRTH